MNHSAQGLLHLAHTHSIALRTITILPNRSAKGQHNLSAKAGWEGRQTACRRASSNVATPDFNIARLCAEDQPHDALAQFQRNPTAAEAVCLIKVIGKPRGDLASAFSVYETLDREQKVNVEVVTALAWACVENGKAERAVPFLWEAVKDLRLSLSPACFGVLVRACAQAGDGDTAYQLFAEVRKRKWLAGRGENQLSIATRLAQAMSKLNPDEKAAAACLELVAWLNETRAEIDANFFAEVLRALGPRAPMFHSQLLDSIFQGALKQSPKAKRATLVSILKACGVMRDVDLGQQLHDRIRQDPELKDDVPLNNTLVAMYGRCGRLAEARQVFDQMPTRSSVTWNAMISVYAQHEDRSKEAVEIFEQMQRTGFQGDNRTMCSVLKVCGEAKDIQLGQQLHDRIRQDPELRKDVHVQTALVTMYGRCGRLAEARLVFDQTRKSDTGLWNAMISVYAQHEDTCGEAINLFRQMERANLQANSLTLISVLKACGEAKDIQLGQELHNRIHQDPELRRNVQVNNALVTMYGRCGKLGVARSLFDRMPMKTSANSWNAMISLYVQQQYATDAIRLYQEMRRSGVAPDERTLSSVVSACAETQEFGLGKQIHSEFSTKLAHSPKLAAALIYMYAKTDHLQEAEAVWSSAYQAKHYKPHDMVSLWNAMIGAYGEHGFGRKALSLFYELGAAISGMNRLEPNMFTFTNVLMACSHAGLVDEAFAVMKVMEDHFGMQAATIHHNCLLDTLARAGRLQEAEQYLARMEHPNVVSFMTVLGGARTWKNVALAEEMARRIKLVLPKDASARVLLGNTYALAGQFGDRDAVWDLMRLEGVRKTPGHSTVLVEAKPHNFKAHERDHPEIDLVMKALPLLFKEIQEAGYRMNKSHVLHALDDEDELMKHLCGHSEKLAIQYGLLKTPEGTKITVTKNLRVCPDCHEATKYIALVKKRFISVRDANRWHHFTPDGKCNCNDYW